MKTYRLVLIFIMAVMVLAACGGGEEETAPTEPPEAPPTAEPAQPEGGQPLPPPVEPPGEGSSDPFSPPPDGLAGQPPIPENFITEFGNLTIGERVALEGQLALLDVDDGPSATLTDDAGNTVNLLLPPPILSSLRPLVGQPVQLTGEVAPAENDAIARIEQVIVYTAAPGGGAAPPGGPPGSTTGEQPPFESLGIEILDVTLGSDLTALQAHDALVEQVDVTPLQLSSISGSPQAGWTMIFTSPESGEATSYTVRPDGTVTSETVDLGPVRPNPLDRGQVVVDSDVLVEEFGAEQTLSLFTGPGGNATWEVADGQTIDAATPR